MLKFIRNCNVGIEVQTSLQQLFRSSKMIDGLAFEDVTTATVQSLALFRSSRRGCPSNCVGVEGEKHRARVLWFFLVFERR